MRWPHRCFWLGAYKTPMPLPDPYEQVADEINAGVADQALWVRSWGEADGDSDRALAIYVRHRAAQVQAIYREADRIAQEAVMAARRGDRQRAALAARQTAQRQRAEWWQDNGWIVTFILVVVVILFFCHDPTDLRVCV